MNQDTTKSLMEFGLDVARHIAGYEAVQQVEVAPGEEFDRPVYHFRFLIDQDRARQRVGLIRLRLIQMLRDELIARNYPPPPLAAGLDR